MNQLQECLEYCRQHNGIPECKNCGLSQEIIDDYTNQICKEAVEEVIDEIRALAGKHTGPTEPHHTIYNELRALEERIQTLANPNDN